MDSRIVFNDFSEYVNRQELEYRENIQPNEEAFQIENKWLERINDGRREIVPYLLRHLDIRGNILEVGAGSCWMSAELSKIPAVTGVYALDMSRHVLQTVAPVVMEVLHAEAEKITRVVGDFNQLYFEDEKFNFVFCDAALHHIPETSFNRVLMQIKRVLKPGGFLIAIREPILTPVGFLRCRREKFFGQHEKKYGVTENIYTEKEWREKISGSGFDLKIITFWRDSKHKPVWKRIINGAVRLSGLKNHIGKLKPCSFGQNQIFILKPCYKARP